MMAFEKYDQYWHKQVLDSQDIPANIGVGKFKPRSIISVFYSRIEQLFVDLEFKTLLDKYEYSKKEHPSSVDFEFIAMKFIHKTEKSWTKNSNQ